MPRSLFTFIALLAATILLTGCNRGTSTVIVCPEPPNRNAAIDQSLARAVRYLLDRQSPDGAWRSDTYGHFKDGSALTPLVAATLLELHEHHASAWEDEVHTALVKACDYLSLLATKNGTGDRNEKLAYPVYTAALSSRAFRMSDARLVRNAGDRWLKELRSHQLTEDLDWQPEDKPYGGWGYCSGLPRKPKPGELPEPMTESNLSATVFALRALRAAGATTDDPAIQKALVFVKRCQNHPTDGAEADAEFDNGGFFFIYDDPVRNKAGAVKDRHGRERFRSYGSTTADGLQALLLCGLDRDDPRVVAARNWLEKHFDAAQHPGDYPADRQANRDAVYHYYLASMTSAYRLLDLPQVQTPAGPVRWSEAVSRELMRRQRADSSWRNTAVAVREDDPIVATCLAVQALMNCRE